MNLLNTILNEKEIGGLEIADDGFRFCKIKKGEKGLNTEVLIEEKLNQQELTDENAAFNRLTKFIKQNNLEYVIVSILSETVFLKNYEFNPGLSEEKIKDAMDLNVELQLPKNKNDIYCDWMKMKTGNNVLLAYALKDYIDKLTARLKNTGLKIIAIESHQISLARAIKQDLGETSLVIEKTSRKISFYLIKNQEVIFSKITPNNLINKDVHKEVDKIIKYHDWLGVTINKLFLIGDFKDNELKKLPLKPSELEPIKELSSIKDPKWMIVLGAALRGLISRKEDTIISLMEVDTEKAYRQEKASSAISFLTNISVALAVFFTIVLTATWYLITGVQSSYNKQISSFNLSEGADNSATLREKAKTFNDTMEQLDQMMTSINNWSPVVSEMKNKTVEGVVISNFSLTNIAGELSITGLASNREAINNLKKSFESSEKLSEINLPLNNLEKKTNIPFSMTFKVKN